MVRELLSYAKRGEHDYAIVVEQKVAENPVNEPSSA